MPTAVVGTTARPAPDAGSRRRGAARRRASPPDPRRRPEPARPDPAGVRRRSGCIARAARAARAACASAEWEVGDVAALVLAAEVGVAERSVSVSARVPVARAPVARARRSRGHGPVARGRASGA